MSSWLVTGLLNWFCEFGLLGSEISAMWPVTQNYIVATKTITKLPAQAILLYWKFQQRTEYKQHNSMEIVRIHVFSVFLPTHAVAPWQLTAPHRLQLVLWVPSSQQSLYPLPAGGSTYCNYTEIAVKHIV